MTDIALYRSNFYEGPETRTAGLQKHGNGVSAGAPALHATPDESSESGGFLSIFKNIVDIVNPLQHIPIVGSIYRRITGDEIGPVAKVAGGALYGGPVGGAVSLATEAAKSVASGKITSSTVSAAAVAQDTQLAAQAPINRDEIIWDKSHSLIELQMNQAMDKYLSSKENSKVYQNAVNLSF